MSTRYIAIAGNIGAGKSSLVSFLAKRFQLHPLYEPVDDNPYLEGFYEDMKAWAFHSQIFYLARKFALHAAAEKTTGRIVLDRTIYEDAEIFAASLKARRLISRADWGTYRELYEVIREHVQPPDLMIYLKCSVRGLKRRIKQRGREMEQEIPTDYLRQLNQRYDKWFEHYGLGPKAIIETDKMDYLHDLVDRVELIEEIETLLGET
jgi:deoxyadenosine/deoxycytidine kinase